MVNFLNDGSLVGFWPLHEASGAPFFQNYSPARSRRPSGISYDMHVATAESLGVAQVKSIWPGTAQISNPTSGTLPYGYVAQGFWRLGSDSSPYSHYLINGDGSSQSRQDTLVPNVAQSGFTVGFWVYPNSDGFATAVATDLNVASFSWETELARAHTLIGQHQYNQVAGWHFGISGQLSRAAQNNFTYEGGRQLAAFVTMARIGGSPQSIRVPIESGVYTHLTFSYRFVNGTTTDEIVLYKNGRVAASGNTNFGASQSLTLNNANLITRALSIGGSDNAAGGSDDYSGTSGWNHLMSGVYFFRRPLHEGEILDLHNGSTLQALDGNVKSRIKVDLTDPKLLAYYPFRSVGFPDVSKNHRPLGNTQDEGPAASLIPIPGPFKGGATLQNGTTSGDVLIASSGLLYDMLNSRSWTIGVVAGPTTVSSRPNNMVFSMGSISSTTTGGAPVATAAATFGFSLTILNATPAVNRMRLSVHPLGDITGSVFNVDIPNSGFFNGVSHHYALAYDDGTKGLAVYYDGHTVCSGTLATSLTDHLMRLAGSGYPLLFTNGVTNALADAVTLGVPTNGGNDTFIGPILVMGRALLPEELRYIAQSGIDTTSTWRTLYDSRLVGYWPCTDFKLDDVIAEDRARVWEIFPGNLVRGDTTTKWSAWYALNQRTNQFGTRTTPTALDSFGVLGITSGIFGVHGLSAGTANVSDAASIRSSIANFTQRYKPVNEQNNLLPQNVLGEFIIGYEVTPSGTIPSTPFGLTADNTKFEFNSTLSLYGNLAGSTANGELRSFLTTVDAAQGSGVSLVFASRTGTFNAANYTGLVSGVLPFGIPSKVLFHSKFDSPYNIAADTAGTTPVTVTLWINGAIAARRAMTAATARVWAIGAPNGATDDFLLEFGGEAGNDALATTITRDGGLGDIYMRQIFLMRGIFDKDEVAALAASGIQSPTITGYTPTLAKTQVTVADQSLKGYWRFNGLDGGGSGTKDLSLFGNHLSPLSERQNRLGGSTQSSRSWTFLPGPLKNSDLGVQCSGITYRGSPAGAASQTPPFAVSGIAFDSPQDGFSVGFFMAARATPSLNTAEVLLSYGVLSATNALDTSINLNRGWAILNDDNGDTKMVMSIGGAGYLDNSSATAQSGQLVCGAFEADSIYEDLTRFNNYLFGNPKPPRLDFWSHYCWTWDPTQKELKCFVNGQEVDRKATKVAQDPMNGGPASGLNPIVPANPASRMITFLTHQQTNPWDFSATVLNNENSVLTDVFYFKRALTEAEIRYISQNGIDSATGTTTSGVIGGYILGAGQGSGAIGGYTRGQDSSSGIIGGWSTGAFSGSGIIGGFCSGVIFQGNSSGIFGGYIRGSDSGSGLFGGYIRGAGAVSGIFGGFMLGGLRNSMQFDGGFVVQAYAALDFDSQLTLRKSTSADFDAKLIIFQAETGPVVDIIVPHNTVIATPPFNQYLIGAASGTQGKSIVQTRWTFGDFTSPVSVAQSGAGLYPAQHYYAGSGFYIAKFEAIDSNGLHGSATRIINAAVGIDPVIISLSGVPRSGSAALTVDFTTTVNTAPPGVAVIASLVNFDDGQSTISFNPTHVYNEPGTYKPIWAVRDSRGVIWSDSLEAGSDLLRGI